MEDAVVHEQDAQLGPHEVEGVQNLGHDEKLGHADDVVERDFVCVDAHARRVHGKNETHDKVIPELMRVGVSSSLLSHGTISIGRHTSENMIM